MRGYARRCVSRVVVMMVSVIGVAACARNGPVTGDLIFQDLDCGEVCDAIEQATLAQFGVAEPRLSHVGLITIEDGVPYVIEAYPPAVARRPLVEVLARPQNAPPRFVHSAALCLGAVDPSVIVRAAKTFLGRPYDDAFTDNNEAFYCSELIHRIFKQANGGKECFTYMSMHFGAVGSRERRIWNTYFQARGMTVPEGRPGVSPLGLWLSAHGEPPKP